MGESRRRGREWRFGNPPLEPRCRRRRLVEPRRRRRRVAERRRRRRLVEPRRRRPGSDATNRRRHCLHELLAVVGRGDH
jgi:hypothetical protein